MKEINIHYNGEKGHDVGGIRRDWFTCLTKEIFRSDRGIFKIVSNGTAYAPNPQCTDLEMFHFAGRIVARAVMELFPLPICLCRAFLKHILGQSLTLDDLEDYDPALYRGLTQLRELKDDLSAVGQMFEIDYEEGGQPKTALLIPDGDTIDVTQDNREEYIGLVLDFRLEREFSSQLHAFLEGFYSLIPQNEIAMFRTDELGRLISGMRTIDPDEFENHVEYAGGYHRDHPVIQMFFEVFREFTEEERGKLLEFVTGASKPPAEGFASYARSGGPFTISREGDFDHLPTAHTCLRCLGLPPYERKSDMKEKIARALDWSGASGFGFV
jgi:E3 ubiquitin-protein ligase HUWE1